MSWTLTHGCASESGPIEVRLFDQTNGLIFPGGTDRYLIAKDGTETMTVTCVPGDRICLGAAAVGGRASWGMGPWGDRPCSTCCNPCGQIDPTLSLTCQ
jgi:hypothetical protein